MTYPVFVATLGQRPEAITTALDVLHPRYHYTDICIVHTHPELSGIAEAYQLLFPKLQDYPQITVNSCEITLADGTPMIDIQSVDEGETYFRAVTRLLRNYRVAMRPIHLLVAGGRKAMSIYATLAASTLFGEHDKVWTVLTPPELMQPGQFHAQTGTQDRVQIVELPVQYSHLIPGEIARRDLDNLLKRQSPRQQFVMQLTPTEKAIAETLSQHPYASNEELGEIMKRSHRTIENHLGRIYNKLFQHFDLKIEDNRKRQALIDVMSGRV
ncbi:MAG: CRISPR-associated ring nuclease [Chloroflexota bacterium]